MVKNSWLKENIELYKKKIVYFLTIFFVIFSAYFFVYTIKERIRIFSRVLPELHAIAVERKKELLTFLDDHKKQVSLLAQNQEFITRFIALQNAANTESAQAYKEPEAALDLFFNTYKSGLNYKDIFLIQPNGTLFYSNKIDLIGEKNLLHSSLAGDLLAQSFNRVRLTFTLDISEFGISKITREPALFITCPLFYNNQFIGAVAVWIDENSWYKIIHNYSGLGRTGDIYITKNIGDRMLFVAPTRSYAKIAFKKISNLDNPPRTPAGKASFGQQGKGKIVDSFGTLTLAAWQFIAQINLGLTVTMHYTEMIQSLQNAQLFLKVFLILLLLCIILIIVLHRASPLIKKSRSLVFSKRTLRLVFWIVFLISAATSFLLLWHYHYTYYKIFNNTKKQAQIKINVAANFINQHSAQIEKTGQMIAKDLQRGALKKEDIAIRLERNLKEIPDIDRIIIGYAPFGYDPKNRLFALETSRTESSIQTATVKTDYMIPSSGDDPQAGWYDKAIKEKAFWSEPFYNKLSAANEIIYALPFYQGKSEQPAGVIAVVYNLNKILRYVRAIEIGKTGYAVLLSSKQKFIHHPLEKYVKENIGLADLMKEQNNVALKEIAEQMVQSKSGSGSYYDQASELKYWIVYAPIPVLKWTIAGIFSGESFELPITTLHKERIWILISFVIAIFLFLLLFLHAEQMQLRYIRLWSVSSALLFAFALIVFWWLVYSTPYRAFSDIVILRDQTSLDKYLEYLSLDAYHKNEKQPISVATGIIVQTLSFSDSTKVVVSGYIWQKIKNSSVVPGIRFPEAIEVKLKKVVDKNIDDQHIIGWNFSGSFLQKHRYSWFPFDKIHVDIDIASADFENDVVLVPDFSSYQSLEIDPLPGITNKIGVPGFDLEQSFFSFSSLPLYDEVGIEALAKNPEKARLHYNLVLNRKLTNPFIIFFLPLLIILFAIYSVFLVSFRGSLHFDIFKSLGAYTALFFSLIIVHQTLRNQYQAGELLYIEYFFFFTYITILFLILHDLILRVTGAAKFINKNISPYLRILFWLIQFAVWFIITMIVFYKLR